jgi:hypothetical protein
MVQAFDVLRFDDAVLQGVVLTLDRYYARQAEAIEVTAIQRVLLSAVCTEMKLSCSDEFPPMHWQRVLDHLCHGRLSLAAILQTELEVLEQLDWVVGVPTPVTFLRELSIRLRGGSFGETTVPATAPGAASADRCSSLALFLLELALFEPNLEYGFHHTVLAAGALSASLRTLDAEAELHEILLEDLATYCPDVTHLEEQVHAAEEALLEHWAGCASGFSQWGEFYVHLETKFSSQVRHKVARLSPRTALGCLRATRPPDTGRSSRPSSFGSAPPSVPDVSPKGERTASVSGAAAARVEVKPKASSRAILCI